MRTAGARGRLSRVAVLARRLRWRVVLECLLVAAALYATSQQFPKNYLDTGLNPDGYIGHALTFKEGWDAYRNANTTRMPGYAAFLNLIAADLLVPAVLDSPDPNWALRLRIESVHTALLLVFLFVLWIWIRRVVNPLVALIFISIFAFPNNLVRSAYEPFPDLLTVIPFSAVAYLGYRFLSTEKRGIGVYAWHLSAIAVLLLLLQSLRPNAGTFVLIWVLSLTVTYLALRRRSSATACAPSGRAVLIRAGAVVLVSCLCIVASFRIMDPGGGVRQFMRYWFVVRLSLVLPPASDTSDTLQFEEAKKQVEAETGVRFTTDLRFADRNWVKPYLLLVSRVPWPLFEAEARARLLAHPLEFLRVTWLQMLRAHHLTARRYYIYSPHIAFHEMSYSPNIVPRDIVGTPEATAPLVELRRRLFFGLGLHFGEERTVYDFIESAFELVFNWALMVIGIWYLYRRYPWPTTAAVCCVFFSLCFLAATHNVDGRYILSYAALIHLGQAAGLSVLPEIVVERREERHLRLADGE